MFLPLLLLTLILLIAATAYTALLLLSPTPLGHTFSETQYTSANHPAANKGHLARLQDEPECGLTVVVPAFNERERLPLMVDEAMRFLVNTIRAASPQETQKWWNGGVEVLVIDDGSTDDTVEVAERLAERWQQEGRGVGVEVRVVRLERNRGKGGAVRHATSPKDSSPSAAYAARASVLCLLRGRRRAAENQCLLSEARISPAERESAAGYESKGLSSSAAYAARASVLCLLRGRRRAAESQCLLSEARISPAERESAAGYESKGLSSSAAVSRAKRESVQWSEPLAPQATSPKDSSRVRRMPRERLFFASSEDAVVRPRATSPKDSSRVRRMPRERLFFASSEDAVVRPRVSVSRAKRESVERSEPLAPQATSPKDSSPSAAYAARASVLCLLRGRRRAAESYESKGLFTECGVCRASVCSLPPPRTPSCGRESVSLERSEPLAPQATSPKDSSRVRRMPRERLFFASSEDAAVRPRVSISRAKRESVERSEPFAPQATSPKDSSRVRLGRASINASAARHISTRV
ncbi:hypothetical protein QFC22_001083 [Naganishia vaughanmartiniae]|uniref:Uncharacterized protein n=1 Tax=Naganishia vaughanmartiniae TaxID=1424756 RepID=A0ACC2XJW2_9TREE|nr:hypothetical protein QFC22_001083 [Naganishia vaughanmartiniae]